MARINLIAGMNGSGKTALLEALFIHSGINPELAIRVNVFRGINPVTFEVRKYAEAPWDSVFMMHDTTRIIELEGDYDNYPRRIIRLRGIHDMEETEKTSNHIRNFIAANKRSRKSPLLSETIQTLRLDFSQGNRKSSHDLMLDHIIDEQGERVRIRVNPPSPPSPYQTVFLPARFIRMEEDIDRFGRLEAAKRLDYILKTLKILEPRLKDLAIITEKGIPLIAGDIGFSKLVPVPYMGEGAARLMSLLLAIGYAENGIVLLDEIENGLHHTVLEKVWRLVAEAARTLNVQIFATTHSFECIRAAHVAFVSRKDYDFRLYRLERMKNETSVVTYSKETLSAAVEAGYEVR
jgi:AAA15 family ATPase/GTPase